MEVNNTDAEGRLVLSDGCAYAAKDLSAGTYSTVHIHTPHSSPLYMTTVPMTNVLLDHIFDMATLTGAQLISTGVKHGAIVCNDDDVEDAFIRAGKATGDLVHPIPFCPEFFRAEFKSVVRTVCPC